ncbi:hypothetical protein M422DRAFT_29680 [Sphaerobolus stellatus SS14]|uniref:Translin n=1 Tax=Sphaerobolus stellatus (strain SS14) TaxID=990650 RepID=A0A0C9VEW4_SPHS4|nr:hypothetical protein M422DRAFT_29680 [Sphaerobolus stellatus SS14]
MTSAAREEIIKVFDGFRQDLDDHNDRRERLIKLSREVTSLSKKVIFLLHRLASEELEDKEHAIDIAVIQSRVKLAEIKTLFEQMRVELEGENFWRYQKTVSGGIQEYLEALSFSHYLEHNTLLSYQDVQEDMKSLEGIPFFPLGVPYEDYVLGVSDLTGELMRFAITSIGRQGISSQANLEKAVAVGNFVRACKADWEPMTPYIKELRSKQDVTTNSLRKIEEVAYSVAIRGFERAKLYHHAYNPPTDDSHDHD